MWLKSNRNRNNQLMRCKFVGILRHPDWMTEWTNGTHQVNVGTISIQFKIVGFEIWKTKWCFWWTVDFGKNQKWSHAAIVSFSQYVNYFASIGLGHDRQSAATKYQWISSWIDFFQLEIGKWAKYALSEKSKQRIWSSIWEQTANSWDQ